MCECDVGGSRCVGVSGLRSALRCVEVYLNVCKADSKITELRY